MTPSNHSLSSLTSATFSIGVWITPLYLLPKSYLTKWYISSTRPQYGDWNDCPGGYQGRRQIPSHGCQFFNSSATIGASWECDHQCTHSKITIIPQPLGSGVRRKRVFVYQGQSRSSGAFPLITDGRQSPGWWPWTATGACVQPQSVHQYGQPPEATRPKCVQSSLVQCPDTARPQRWFIWFITLFKYVHAHTLWPLLALCWVCSSNPVR